jgi:hypothetical protein
LTRISQTKDVSVAMRFKWERRQIKLRNATFTQPGGCKSSLTFSRCASVYRLVSDFSFSKDEKLLLIFLIFLKLVYISINYKMISQELRELIVFWLRKGL